MIKKILTFFILCASFSPLQAQKGPAIIVRLKDKASLALVQKKYSAEPFLSAAVRKNSPALLSAEGKQSYSELEKYCIVNGGAKTDSLLKVLRSNPDVAEVYIARKFRIEQAAMPDDSAFAQQWALERIQALKAWERATGKGISIGFVDTGVDYLHPELVSQFQVNTKEDLNGNGRLDPWSSLEKRNGLSGDFDGTDNDGNGYRDDVIGYDFVDQHVMNVGDAQTRDGDPSDEQGHGTSVAGVLAARSNNGIGISGLAYDSRLVALRAFDATGNGEEDDIAASIVYAALNKVRVLNLSFGDVIHSPVTRDAIRFARATGMVVIASSGNDGGTGLHFPSDYPEVISVGSTNQDDRRSFFSSYGSYVTLVAPGERIVTTGAGGSYRTMQGTSFSAPYVAAASALILQLMPGLGQEDIRAILESSADPVGKKNVFDREWTTLYGAGRLNAAKALEAAVGRTRLSVVLPLREAEFERSKWSSIPVAAEIATPFFRGAKIEYGMGNAPESWTSIYSTEKQTLGGDTLAWIPVQALRDTNYVLRLSVELVTGATVERRAGFTVVSGRIAITSLEASEAWFNERRALVIALRSDRRSNAFLKLPPPNDTAFPRIITDVERFSRNHTFLLPDDIALHSVDSAEIFVVSQGRDTVSQKISLRRSREAFPQTGMRRKSFSMPLSYLMNRVDRDFYGDNLPTVVVSDIASGSYDLIKTYQFRNGNFAVRDSGSYWIPRGIGDSNGDGIPEVFAHSRGKSVLFQAGQKSGNPFSGQLFSETNSLDFWASDMKDIDGDGRDELIARSDSAYFTMKFSNGSYVPAGIALNTTEPAYRAQKNYFGVPVSATGDFDGDGRKNLSYADEDGSLLIFEWNGSGFELEKIFEHENYSSASSEFVAAADVDGDGIPEILHGYPLTQKHENMPDGEYLPQLWNFIVVKGSAGGYSEIWREKFYGVRLGELYQYGLSAGDINGKKGEEIIISTFPNLYTFTWDVQKNSLVPNWHYPLVYTNSALVYDFDGNGRNEIGFGAPSDNGLETVFFESYAQNLPVPGGVDAVAQNESGVLVKWNPVPGATRYRVYIAELPDNTGTAQPYAETDGTSLLAGKLKNYTSYGFFVLAIFGNGEESELSVMAEAYTHPRITLTGIEMLSPGQLRLKFSGRVPQTIVDPSFLSISPALAVSSLQWAGDSSIVLVLAENARPGEYELDIAEFRDYYRTFSLPSKGKFTAPADSMAKEMYLTRLLVRDNSLIELFFSEMPDAESAGDPSNYSFRPFGSISRVVVSQRDSSVGLYLSEALDARGKNYTVTAGADIRSSTGRSMTAGAGNTLAFSISAPDLRTVYTYPNPVKISRDETVSFGGLPRFARATVQTLEGRILAELNETDANGGVEWNLRMQSGEKVGTGIYLIQVSLLDEQGAELEKIMKKFAVVQ